MLKRGLLVVGMLLVLLLLVGCWVSKDDYDTVVAERDAAIANLQSAQAEVSSLSSELAEKEQQLSDIEQLLSSVGPKLEIGGLLSDYNYNEWLRADEEIGFTTFWDWVMVDFKGEMTRYVIDVDDNLLSNLWDDAFEWHGESYTLWYDDYDDLYSYVEELILADFEALWAVLLAD